MKKTLALLAAFALTLLLFPLPARAAGASFKISGPDTLQTGQTGTYTVKVSVSDAAAAQATLSYDGGFFELVSGNPKGEWDSSANQDTTVSLITVTLRCVGAAGTSGSLSLSDKRASRLTGGDPPSESVSCSGGSKTVSNPVPEPTPSPTPVPTATPAPSRTAAPSPRRTPRASASAAATPAVTATPIMTPAPSGVQTPAATPTPALNTWEAAARQISTAAAGDTVSVKPPDSLIPAEVLALLKQRGCVLSVALDGAVCTLDGGGISDASWPLDIGVSREKDAALSAAAGGADLFQLHFAFAGELPCALKYRVKAGGCAPGDMLSLCCRYAHAGASELVQTAMVDSEGYATFAVCHGQDYYVTLNIADEAAAQAGAVQAAPGVKLPVFFACVAGAALLGAFAALYMLRSALRARRRNRGKE